MKTYDLDFVRSDMSVLREFNNPDAGHVFLHFSPTIREELRNYDNLLEKLDKDTEVYLILKDLRDSTSEIEDSFLKEKDQMIMAAKRPVPSPCPGGSSSCLLNASYLDFFDLDFNEELMIYKNDELLETKTVGYDELTKIRTVKLAEQLVYDENDVIKLEFPVTVRDEDGTDFTTFFSKQIIGFE